MVSGKSIEKVANNCMVRRNASHRENDIIYIYIHINTHMHIHTIYQYIYMSYHGR